MSRNTFRFVRCSWLSRSSRSRALREARRRSRRLRPGLLELEVRKLPATFTVMNTNASGSGSLAAAVAAADANNQANTINFAQSAFSGDPDITLGGSSLDLSDTGGLQTIKAPASGVIVSGGGTSGVFQIGSGVTATLSNLSIVGGKASGNGGGVDNEGTVSLSDCTLSGDSAGKSGGGLYNAGSATLSDCTIAGDSAGTGGGGLLNWISAQLTLTDCTLSGNSATNDGGGLYDAATATLTDCTIVANSAGLVGGGLNCASPATANLTNTIVAGNTNPSGASDITGFGTVSGTYDLIGPGGSGALANGTNHNIVLAATSLSSLAVADLAYYGGPVETMALLPGSAAIGKGTAVSGVTTDERGLPVGSPPDIGAFQTAQGLVVNTTVDADVSPPGGLTLREAVNITQNTDSADRGATETITFEKTVFAKPQTITLVDGSLAKLNTGDAVTIMGPAAGVTISGGDLSGVLEVESGATVTLTGLTITDGNGQGHEGENGGGVDNLGTVFLTDCTLSGNSAPSGGGLYNGGTAVLTDCTLSGNSAQYGGGLDNAGTATLADCTLSGNSAKVHGGGLDNGTTAMLTLLNCTISANTAVTAAGGLNNFGNARLTNTIIAGNTNASGSAADDINGSMSVFGTYDLIGTGGAGGLTNGKNHNIVLTSLATLGLAPLGSYGGTTQTMALLPGSAALGAGTALANGVTTDQRGDKLDAPDPDIGAYQSQGFTLTPYTGSTPQNTFIGYFFANSLAVVVKANDPNEPVAGGVISFAAPSSGASAVLSGDTATIGTDGLASVTATANSSVGSYKVAASITGTTAVVDFHLTNLAQEVAVVMQPLPVYKHKKLVSLGLEVTIEPKFKGAGVPTGMITIELVQKHKKPKVLGMASLSHGMATVRMLPTSVVDRTIEIVYSGSAQFLKNTLATVVKFAKGHEGD
jgi:hypothetical protein